MLKTKLFGSESISNNRDIEYILEDIYKYVIKDCKYANSLELKEHIMNFELININSYEDIDDICEELMELEDFDSNNWDFSLNPEIIEYLKSNLDIYHWSDINDDTYKSLREAFSVELIESRII